jgi:hypothetical protein
MRTTDTIEDARLGKKISKRPRLYAKAFRCADSTATERSCSAAWQARNGHPDATGNPV